MNEIIQKIFWEYNFTKIWEQDNRVFFSNKNKNIVSYFILNFVDCTNMEDNEEVLKYELNKLEEDYIGKQDGLKYSIANSLENKYEISQIDKNTSAIYLVKFTNVNLLLKYRNLIYSIEESPNYFRRYILPYTEQQVMGLKKVLYDYDNKNIIDVLSDLADDEKNYYSLMNGKNDNSVYELVIRLFSKVPFLQYQFKAQSEEYSLEKIVDELLEDELRKFEKIIEQKEIFDISIEELLSLEQEKIPEEEINKYVKQLLEKEM